MTERPLISSVRIEPAGPRHEHVHIWTRGGKAGFLTVSRGDGELIRELLMPAPPSPAPSGVPIVYVDRPSVLELAAKAGAGAPEGGDVSSAERFDEVARLLREVVVGVDDENTPRRATSIAARKARDTAIAYIATMDTELARLREAVAGLRDGHWIWIGEGEDDLDSMSEAMRVSISARQIRELLARLRERVRELEGESLGYTRIQPGTLWSIERGETVVKIPLELNDPPYEGEAWKVVAVPVPPTDTGEG